ncbi:MAG: hypothetical protein KAT79_04515, partial [candidate division Zixibacteria bacterium]|nr:hypothetical protein [candidate division Zixibacteria bacterium]
MSIESIYGNGLYVVRKLTLNANGTGNGIEPKFILAGMNIDLFQHASDTPLRKIVSPQHITDKLVQMPTNIYMFVVEC